MFIGHFAVGMASKRLAPRTSLGLLIGAAQLCDLLWPLFLLAGWERVRIVPGDTAFTPLSFDSYPISHSLLTVAGWAACVAAIYFLRSRYATGAVVVAACVLSHWVLDAVSHRPDMPLYPGGPVVGLGLWNSVPLTAFVESLMFGAGVVLYVAAVRRAGGKPSRGFWVYAGVLVLMYMGNLLGPPPPSVHILAVVALGIWIFPVWAHWVDFHTQAVRG